MHSVIVDPAAAAAPYGPGAFRVVCEGELAVPEPVALVVGASGGIGAATVRAFLAAGHRVVLAAPPDARLAAIAAELEAFGDRVLVVPTDITRRDEIDRLVGFADGAYGRVDVLANVAGIGAVPALGECSDAEIEAVLAVNLLGAARCIHAVLPIMKRRRAGAIVNVGSVAGEAAVMGIYTASKFGLRGLTDSLRRELRQYGIRVSLIQPGFVATPMNAAMRNLPGPEIVADAIVAAARRSRRRGIVPGHYAVALWLVGAFPVLTDLVFGDRRIQDRLNRDARTDRAS